MQDSAALTVPTQPRRPFGRSLGDFRIDGKDTPHGLWPAEESLLEAVARGETCRIGSTLPEAAIEGNRVRGAVLRFLLLGGDEDAPVHEKGLQLYGAFVDGDIDLANASAVQPLFLWQCQIAGELIGRNASLGRLILPGSHIRGIQCDSAKVTGDVFLREGFVSEGEVRFLGAEIGGGLNCSKGTFKNPDGFALNCDGAKVTGDVFLSNGFAAEGEVRFPGAEIGGQLACSKASFKNPGGFALNCDGAKVTGDVFLSNGFAAEGEVRFLGAEIGGGLYCSKGTFKNPSGLSLNCDSVMVTDSVFLSDGFAANGEVRFLGAEIGGDFTRDGGSFKNPKARVRANDDEPLTADTALNLAGARINGALWLGPAAAPSQQVTMEGSIDLQATHATALVDDVKSWPAASVTTENDGRVPCVMRLDGFTYDRFAGVAPTDAATRLEWLRRQPADHLGKSFRPQPFEQLVKVLRAMGHDNDARLIAMYKQQYLQPLRVARAALWRRPFVWLIGELWAVFAGYGYRPHRLIVTLLMLWLASGMFYEIGAGTGQFVPADAQVWTTDLRDKCEPNWTTCDKVSGMIGFNSLVYSADVLIPIIDLRQRSTWAPRPGWVRALTWFENIAGAACVLLLGAILGGLVKRD